MATALVEECEQIGHALVEVAERGEAGRVNRDLVHAIADHGLFERLFGAEGITATDLCAMRQGLARVCTEAETALAVQGLGAIPIHLDGSPQIRDELMPRIRRGDTVAAFALTEPGSAPRPRRRSQSRGWGRYRFISMVPHSSGTSSCPGSVAVTRWPPSPSPSPGPDPMLPR